MTTPTLAPALELLFVACWIIIPALFACRLSRRLGVLLGTLAFWAFSVVHPLIAPERYFLGGADSLLFGWLSGFLYSALCYRVAKSLRQSERIKLPTSTQ
jgi:hypothetical protein